MCPGNERAGAARRAERLKADIADAMEVEPELLPAMAELLQDLPDLSGMMPDVLKLLERGLLSAGAAVLDLGCGRGDIALAIARKFNAHVLGVDGYVPFIEIASASAAGCTTCSFRVGDLREPLGENRFFDAALLIAVGPVIGGYATTIEAVRRVVRPGGLILVGDAFLADGVSPRAEWGYYAGRRQTEAELTAHGDVIEEVMLCDDDLHSCDEIGFAAVQKRAEHLARTRPELAGPIERYLDGAWLNSPPVTDAVWMLRRSAGAKSK